ncbi:5'-3' exoribonuclease 2-like [Ctenocephalides felis]|uniref:5'-3' exoribonuclease 2-like n=1 Tax=Ctenocephalides felis TaxID=7515 RepID=UPI000E6E4914|nr:5'-3' exoribonuclease 2-like [Ctenocephalides felis]
MNFKPGSSIFSQRNEDGLQNSGYLEANGNSATFGTGEFLIFMDCLFESVNGLTKLPVREFDMTAVGIIFQKIKSNSLPDNKTISLMPVEYENSDDVGLYFHEVFKEKDIRIYYHDKSDEASWGPTGPSSTYSESGEDVASKVGTGGGYRGRGYYRGGGRGGGKYRGGRRGGGNYRGCRRGGYKHRGGRRGGGGARYRGGGYYRGGRNYDRAIFIY